MYHASVCGERANLGTMLDPIAPLFYCLHSWDSKDDFQIWNCIASDWVFFTCSSTSCSSLSQSFGGVALLLWHESCTCAPHDVVLVVPFLWIASNATLAKLILALFGWLRRKRDASTIVVMVDVLCMSGMRTCKDHSSRCKLAVAMMVGVSFCSAFLCTARYHCGIGNL